MMTMEKNIITQDSNLLDQQTKDSVLHSSEPESSSSESCTSLSEAAVQYAEQGYSVFPLKPKGKQPATKHGFKDAEKDPELVKQMWNGHDYNIGLCTGKINGFFVVDVDNLEVWGKLLSDNGGELPAGPVVQTGKGLHLFFVIPDDVPIRTRCNVKSCFDVRGDGGYIVAPPSIHSNGNRYEFLTDLFNTPLPQPPEWLLNMIVKKEPSHEQAASEPSQQVIGNGSSYALAALERGCESVAKALEGCRNDMLNRAAFSAGQLVGSGELKEETARGMLMNAGCLCGLHTDEADRTINSGFSAGMLQPRSVPKSESKVDDMAKEDSAEFSDGIEPWHDSVDGQIIAESILNNFKSYTLLPPGAAEALTIWTLGTYCLNAFRIFPKVCLSSPEKRCGKTTTLEVLGALVNKSLIASNITPSAIFRAIDQWHSTLLIDEGDTFMKGNEELRGIINSGHTRSTAFVVRTVGDGKHLMPKRFSTWSAMAIAMIKSPPDTIRDRSIMILLRRKLQSESVDRLPLDLFEQNKNLRRQCLRWAQDHFENLKTAEPQIPEVNSDRAKDNWLPILAIADCLGGEWPIRAREAMMALERVKDDEDSIGPQLLQDIQKIFAGQQSSRIHSMDLVRELVCLEDRPWAEWNHGKQLTTNSLARLLKHYGIKPRQIKIDTVNKNGYELAMFEDAFARYLPNPSDQSSTSLHASNHALSSDIENSTK
ncbi:DUF3631 domain-containing protein [Amphritea sp. HPY]|uniref:DUF3631 domain-containing protein n=1 Tax=Amphritea sp. HPY TaxID=3421652 RepID=UPI003D7ED2FB